MKFSELIAMFKSQKKVIYIKRNVKMRKSVKNEMTHKRNVRDIFEWAIKCTISLQLSSN